MTSDLFKGRYSRIVFVVTAAAGLVAAIAAAPSVSIGKETSPSSMPRLGAENVDTGLRPLARGPAMRVGHAFDAEDEDCTLVVTRTPNEDGHMRVRRSLSCAN